MAQVSSIALLLIGILISLGLGSFAVVSLKERETRAARIALIMFVAAVGLGVVSLLLPQGVQIVLVAIVGLSTVLMLLLFFWPIGKINMDKETPGKRFDERDVIFARRNLIPGTSHYETYYHKNPQNKAADDSARSNPGLLSGGARLANDFHFSSTDGSFFLTEALREAVDGDVAEEPLSATLDQMSAYIRGLTYYYGALDVGITDVKPYHYYSHIGRGTGVYGDPVQIRHTIAVAFTVEMDSHMMAVAPEPATTMESGRQYVEAARVAVQLAAAIRKMGYSARAHIDGNYRVIAPLVARDAGLGEIGRIGILMTPKHGPRVRLGVVTTNLQLRTDQRNQNPAMIDFCNVCTKCARNCPSRSIPAGDQEMVDGALRWKINADTCYRYWTIIGTDCGRCMAVCPYSHPDTLVHNFIRWGNKKSGSFRRFATWMDDVFYGLKPPRQKPPDWMDIA